MKGFVVMNAYPNGEKFYRQSRRIAEALLRAGADVNIARTCEIPVAVGGKTAGAEKSADFAVYLDKDKYLGRILERQGVRLFNRAAAIEACDDKMQTFLALADGGFVLPETVPAPLCYTPCSHPDGAFLARVADRLGFPLVVKKCYGSFGKDVRLIHGMDELRAAAEEYLYFPHLYQRFVSESAGRDIRVVVIGGHAVAAMERRGAAGEFRSNVGLGGTCEAVGASDPRYASFCAAAEKAARLLGLDYCGVDLLEGRDGPILCEINSNAFFEGIEEAVGVDVPRLYAEHIVKEMKKI